MPDKRLAGRRIVVTRPRQQAERLSRYIEEAGGEALRYPTVEILPPKDPEALQRVLADLPAFDMAIFVSPTAVQEGFALIGLRPWPPTVSPAAVGPGTRAELDRHGLRSVIAPASGADSGALLAMPALADVRGRRIVIFRGSGGREVLADTLAARGAQVTYAECYRRARAPTDLAPLVAQWRRDEVHAVTAYSASAVANLLEGLPASAGALVKATPLFASHERIAEAAAARGVREVHVAGPGDDDMLAGLIAFFGSRP